MNDKKDLTKEQLKEQIQRLEYELQRSIKIEQNLAQRLAKKEHEIAILSVQVEEAGKGFEALQKKYASEPKAE